jgi:hypothetical protein
VNYAIRRITITVEGNPMSDDMGAVGPRQVLGHSIGESLDTLIFRGNTPLVFFIGTKGGEGEDLFIMPITVPLGGQMLVDQRFIDARENRKENS